MHAHESPLNFGKVEDHVYMCLATSEVNKKMQIFEYRVNVRNSSIISGHLSVFLDTRGHTCRHVSTHSMG